MVATNLVLIRGSNIVEYRLVRMRYYNLMGSFAVVVRVVTLVVVQWLRNSLVHMLEHKMKNMEQDNLINPWVVVVA